MRIFGWSADSSGCFYYRMHLPLGELAKHGHDTLVNTVMPPDWQRDAEVIVGQRVCLPGATQIWRNLAKAGRFLVLEVDDDLFSVDASSTAPFQFYNRTEILDNLRGNVAAANRVTVSTTELANRLSHLHDDIRVIPNFVPDWLLSVPGARRPDPVYEAVPVKSGHQDGTLVGWAGTGTHAMDWKGLAGPLARLVNRDPRINLHLMGWLPPRMDDLVPAGRLRYTPWVWSVPEYLRSVDFDIGLIPLRPHLFNGAKSDLKFTEYSALGIPSVAADYGPYAESIKDGVTGLLYTLPHQLTAQIRALVDDPERATQIGAAAKDWAAGRTIEGNWRLWERALTP